MIAAQGFAEAAVRFLHGAQPTHGALAIFFRGERNRFEGAQHAACSVDVIDAPTAEPGTIFALILQKEFQAALHRRMVRGPAVAAQALEDTRRYVGSRGIDHRVVVGERNVAEERLVIVAVERAPASVAVLHAEQPLNAAAHGSFHALGIGKFHAL